jgi:hypothetical protein
MQCNLFEGHAVGDISNKEIREPFYCHSDCQYFLCFLFERHAVGDERTTSQESFPRDLCKIVQPGSHPQITCARWSRHGTAMCTTCKIRRSQSSKPHCLLVCNRTPFVLSISVAMERRHKMCEVRHCRTFYELVALCLIKSTSI